MKLKDSLYRITRQPAEGMPLEYEVRLNEKHFIYQAHFPGEPVTPGVCIVQMAKELLEDHLQQSLQLTTVKNVKFLSVITPIETPELSYVLDKIQSIDTIRAQFTVKSSDKEFAKLSLGFINK